MIKDLDIKTLDKIIKKLYPAFVTAVGKFMTYMKWRGMSWKKPNATWIA